MRKAVWPFFFYCLLCVKVDVTDATKTAEAFLKIASVYKEENNDVKNAVLDTIGKILSVYSCLIKAVCCWQAFCSFFIYK